MSATSTEETADEQDHAKIWAQLKDYAGNFQVTVPQRNDSICLFGYNYGLLVPAKVFKILIDLDISLREKSQRLEYLDEKLGDRQRDLVSSETAGKSWCCGRDDLWKPWIELRDETEATRKRIFLLRAKLTEQEFLLPEKPLKQIYFKIRENRTWYLRNELVKDCKDRGGCCSGGCSCCEFRYVPFQKEEGWTKGQGHCTIECSCCEKNRVFRLDEKEKESYKETFRRSISVSCPAYLLALSESYFSLPGSYPFGRPSRLRSISFYFNNRQKKSLPERVKSFLNTETARLRI